MAKQMILNEAAGMISGMNVVNLKKTTWNYPKKHNSSLKTETTTHFGLAKQHRRFICGVGETEALNMAQMVP
jgi:hypothetical protein